MLRQTDRPAPIRGALRRVGGLLGIALLVLQLMVPQLARANDGAWIEICAEGGATWVQMPIEETGEPCPDCDDCLMCATASDILTPARGAGAARDSLAPRQRALPVVALQMARHRLWPETRGPPFQDKRGAMC